MKYKIAYYIRTDIQHLPPVINIYKTLGGIIMTKTKEIFDFAQENHKDANVLLVKNSSEARKICWFNDIKLVIYTGFQFMSWGYSVQIFHGISDKVYDENRKVLMYDLLLLSGQKQYDKINSVGLIKRPERVRFVGYPKFDKIVNSEINASPQFNNGQKVILYAPTWISENSGTSFKFSNYGESSLPLWGKEIIKNIVTKSDYNLIIKYHSRVNENNKGIYEEISDYILELDANKRVKVIWTADISPLMKEADLMISDISAVCYEWFHLDKPILFANPAPKHYKVSDEKNSSTSAWKAGGVINHDSEIIPLIDDAFKNDSKQDIRHELFNYSFYKPDGKAGERQVAEILILYKKVENYSKIKLMFHNFLKILKIR